MQEEEFDVGLERARWRERERFEGKWGESIEKGVEKEEGAK